MVKKVSITGKVFRSVFTQPRTSSVALALTELCYDSARNASFQGRGSNTSCSTRGRSQVGPTDYCKGELLHVMKNIQGPPDVLLVVYVPGSIQAVQVKTTMCLPVSVPKVWKQRRSDTTA